MHCFLLVTDKIEKLTFHKNNRIKNDNCFIAGFVLEKNKSSNFFFFVKNGKLVKN